MNLQKVKAVKDDDGHWYVIPNEKEERFNTLVEMSEYESNPNWESFEAELIDEFSKYMTGGDLNCTQLYADI